MLKGTKVVFVVLFCMIFVTAAQTENPGTTSFKKIEAFMHEYYNAYNLYAQDMETIDQMDEYWAPEFVSIQYLPIPQYPVMNLAAWKMFLVAAHSGLKETLTVTEMSIDTKNLSVICRIAINFSDRVTGATVLNVDGVGFYNLKLIKGNKIMITELKLYFSDPGALMAIAPGPPPDM